MFLLGFGIILILLMFTLVLKELLYKATGELSMIVVVAMVFGDGIITGLWYYGLTDIYPNEQGIKYGIGFAFMTISFIRAIYFYLNPKPELQ